LLTVIALIPIYFLAGYLLGSIPVAWLITKAITDQDIRELGSGNVGVMNVALSVARWAGIFVFVAELSKGFLTVVISQALGASEVLLYASVLGAVVGTRWPIWLGFQGGRGNTVCVGALLLVSWPTLAIGLGVWSIVRLITRSSFMATRISLILWPSIFGLLEDSWVAFFFGVLMVFIYLTTHEVSTDDHTLIKERWPSLISFLFSPPRKSGSDQNR
jgi:glycerol-3-phosphate acyltransferase PlsY